MASDCRSRTRLDQVEGNDLLDLAEGAWQQDAMTRRIILGLVLLGLVGWLLLVTIGEVAFG